MNYIQKSLFIAVILLLILGLATPALAYTNIIDPILTVVSTGNVGEHNSMAVINGNPAIAYYDSSNSALMYVRAVDSNGTVWGAPVTVDNSANVGTFTSMAVVNGNPAISYFDVTNDRLMYVRAADANGSTWGSPISIHITTIYDTISLVVVNGNPAIAYDTGSAVYYIRATNANGSYWGSSSLIDGNGRYPSLAVVNGRPAVAFYGHSNDLMYIRAADANGGVWGSSVTVHSSGDVGSYPSMAVVNGSPAIAYFDSTNSALRFIRAGDSDGSSWGSPVMPDNTGYVGMYPSLVMAGGYPAIAYPRSDSHDFRVIQANDANGGSWGSPEIVDSGSLQTGYHNSLVEVNGRPAASYNVAGSNDLKYVRFKGTVDISVWDGTTQVPPTHTLDFGSTPEGTPLTKTLTIRNDGLLPLELKTISLPTGFSVVGSYNSSVGSGSSIPVYVRMDAYAPGSPSGVLSISTNDTNKSPYNILIRGSVMGNTTTTITADTSDPSAPGDAVTVSWAVTAVSGTPTGTVTVTTNQSAASCSASVAAGSCDITLNTVGNHTLTADYGGSSDYNPSSGTAGHLVDGQAPEVIDVLLAERISPPPTGGVSNITRILVIFSEDIQDGGCPDGAECIANYDLRRGGVPVVIQSISYSPDIRTAILTLNQPLKAGSFTLTVNGTTSIVDLVGNHLNGGGGTGSDFNLSFDYAMTSLGGGGGGAGGAGGTLPGTGFPDGTFTLLPAQPSERSYSSSYMILDIPSLDVETEIVGVPLVDDEWDVSWLGQQAGYLEGTAFPTWTGNTAISAHVWDANNQPGPFARLGTLVYGDKVMIHAEGMTYTYEVREKYTVFPDDLSPLAHSDYDTLTLITCQGYDEANGQYGFRLVVTAVLVCVTSE